VVLLQRFADCSSSARTKQPLPVEEDVEEDVEGDVEEDVEGDVEEDMERELVFEAVDIINILVCFISLVFLCFIFFYSLFVCYISQENRRGLQNGPSKSQNISIK